MKVFLIILISVSLILPGCDIADFGDINKNVNGPLKGDTGSLLAGAMTNFSTLEGRPYRITPTLYVQYFMQLIYNEEMLYANAPGSWSSYYVYLLSNLQEVIDLVSDPDAVSDPAILDDGALVNQKAVAMIFKSVVFKRVTDLFGDVPYSQALSVETLTPAYDRQEDIYLGLINDVKGARDIIDVDLDGPTGDVIYEGDMTMWVKFANSFLMQMALQLSETSSTKIDVQKVFTDALTHPGGVIETLEEEAWYTFDFDNGFYNPWNWLRPADYGVTRELIQSLSGIGNYKVTSNSTYDRRLLIMLEDSTQDGLPYGYENYYEASAYLANVLLDPETPLPQLTAGYTWLNRAEAAAKGWTGEDVTEMLVNGIKASYASMNALYDPENEKKLGDGTVYAQSRVADIGTVPGGAIQVVCEEKWIALYPLGFDAWAEWRRTGIPALIPAHDAINNGDIPRRYNYPNDETTLNADNYKAAVSRLSPASDNNHARVWWDQ